MFTLEDQQRRLQARLCLEATRFPIPFIVSRSSEWPGRTKIMYLNTSINNKLKEKLVSKSLSDDDYARRSTIWLDVWRAYPPTGRRVLSTPRPGTWHR
jgi:hypothetical protein